MKDAQGNVYALSNNHVYARLNAAQLGEAILQPGLYDTGGALLYSDQVIGTLADFVPIAFGARSSNTIDAAIGQCVDLVQLLHFDSNRLVRLVKEMES